MDGVLMQASNEWASRPDDQRYLNMYDMRDDARRIREHSGESHVHSKEITAVAIEGGSIGIHGKNNNVARMNNWSFGQLAQRAGAPAGYLRTLDPRLAADNLNYSLHVNRDVEDVKVLLTTEDLNNFDGNVHARAVTGPQYGRIWNSDILTFLTSKFGSGTDGTWKVPGEFGKQVPITKANTTLYASDRDMFVFLCDEENRVSMPNRRNNEPGSFARGFFVWNSEVGAQTLGIAAFLFDYVCMNRIVWGVQEFQEVRIRHTSKAPERYLSEVMPYLKRYREAGATPIEAKLLAAQQTKIDMVDSFFRNRQFTSAQTEKIKNVHMLEEQRPIENIFDAVTGITAYAKQIEHTDARTELERRAGKLLTAV